MVMLMPSTLTWLTGMVLVVLTERESGEAMHMSMGMLASDASMVPICTQHQTWHKPMCNMIACEHLYIISNTGKELTWHSNWNPHKPQVDNNKDMKKDFMVPHACTCVRNF